MTTSTEWKPWEVVPRARGFHVSRESSDGQQHEFLLNSVRKVTIFRSPQLAAQACDKANATKSEAQQPAAALAVGLVALFFGAQALSTGPDDIDAARAAAAAERDAIAAHRVVLKTERAAWEACREVYGNLAQVTERPGGEFGCRPLVGVL